MSLGVCRGRLWACRLCFRRETEHSLQAPAWGPQASGIFSPAPSPALRLGTPSPPLVLCRTFCLVLWFSLHLLSHFLSLPSGVTPGPPLPGRACDLCGLLLGPTCPQ